MKIATDFDYLSSCDVTKFLIPLNRNAPVKCEVDGKIIKVSGFKIFDRSLMDAQNDYVEITFAVLNTKPQTQITNPLAIYTYLASDFNLLVDRNTSATATQVEIGNDIPRRCPYHGCGGNNDYNWALKIGYNTQPL